MSIMLYKGFPIIITHCHYLEDGKGKGFCILYSLFILG